MSQGFDARVTPARPDLAAVSLEGKVTAARFVSGRAVRVQTAIADLRRAPSDDAALETQALHGEAFTIYDEKDGWAWGQAALDSYVGYARSDSFAVMEAPTHRVTAMATALFAAPDAKGVARAILPMGAKLAIAQGAGRFARLADGFYAYTDHIVPLGARVPDWVAVAERFLGVPYLWGGKTHRGVDCSGLVQIALEAAGIASPRDTDMMESALGTALALDAALQRGDLVFWKGHMGAMLDETRLLHANATSMQVSIEPIADARARIEKADGLSMRTIKRL